ncbi:MAG: hypothetical protein Q4B26_18390 [Eubacteriales bacterium]|nr:hypothetical protein [Eubacteriales bacterium]
MTAKEFLNQPFELYCRINDKKVRADCYRQMAGSVSSPGFEEHYSSSRNTRAPFERYLEKAYELEDEIAVDEEKLERLKTEVSIAIDKLDEPNAQLLLHYRYVMFMTMPKISVEMNYCLSWTKKIHRKALEEFEKRYPQDTPKILPVHGHHAL